MSARENILSRIRANLRKSEGTAATDLQAAQVYIRSHPRGPRPKADWPDLTARFHERALALGSTVERVAQRSEVPRAVAAYVERQQLQRQAVCWPEFADLDWQSEGLNVESRSAEAEDPIGITGCFCAIAETGTLMLLSGPETPARTSLLPETHIAVVPVARLVSGMEEGWDLLRAEKGQLPRAVNFVSGPSRTADIEQTIVIGAHGPYRVHLVLVG